MSHVIAVAMEYKTQHQQVSWNR